MSEWSDRELGMDRSITRRDFLDGVAVGAGALVLGSVLPGCDLGGGDDEKASGAGSPDASTGLRGLTDEARRIPHQLRDGTFWKDAGEPANTGESYDLVVVGGGISGLAAARFFQREYGEDARILVLDPLEEPGGHASRNEFTPKGSGARVLVGYGGSQSLDTPSSFAKPARQLLADVGVEVKRFERYFDQGFNKRHGLRHAFFFNQEDYGRDQLVFGKDEAEVFRKAPLDARARRDLIELYTDPPDAFPGLSDLQKKARLTDLTYKQFLRRHMKVDEQALRFLQRLSDDLWGFGIDGVGAIDAWADGFPGFDGLKLDDTEPYHANAPTEHKVWDYEDEYIHHFPDGNAGLARSIIRKLIPAAMPGRGMATIPTTELDYGRLDRRGSKVRIRLRSPVVRVRHLGDPERAGRVEVAYVQDGKLRTVTGGHVVLACWNTMIPYICRELPARQREALAFATKLSLMYANVQIRDWTSFAKLRLAAADCRNMYWLGVELDFPVSMGKYQFPKSPDEPIVVHLPKALTKPGLSPREQGRAGRAELMGTTFEQMERATRDQLARVLSGGGFDPARDIEAITVNRWAHGYAYEYGRPWDTFWPDGPLPSHVARRPFGRIAIANSDSAPRAYADTAIDMAYRAVRELKGGSGGEVARGVDGVLPAGVRG